MVGPFSTARAVLSSIAPGGSWAFTGAPSETANQRPRLRRALLPPLEDAE